MIDIDKIKLYSEPDFTDVSTKTFISLNDCCADELSEAINLHYNNYSLNTNGVLYDVLQNRSPSRIAYVLAERIYGNNGFDKRFSKDNEEWADKLLENVHDFFKDKKTSPIQHRLNHYLSSHNCLADMMISEFRKKFPDVTLEPSCEPITANLMPMKNGALTNLTKPSFDTDYDEFRDKGYLCIQMEYPDAETAWELMRRADFDFEYISQTLVYGNELKNCYTDVYEDGSILLILSGSSVPLSIDEKEAIKISLEKYTKERFGLSLAKTVHMAMNGEKPPVKSYIEKE